MNGLARACTHGCSQARRPSGSNPAPTDNRPVSYSSAAASPRFPRDHPFPSIRRGSWPLLGHSPNIDDVAARQLPDALSEWLATEDRLERIRTGGPRIDTRVLALGAALEALLARAPGLRKDGRETMTQVTLVFDDASGKFTGWRPKVQSW